MVDLFIHTVNTRSRVSMERRKGIVIGPNFTQGPVIQMPIGTTDAAQSR